MIINDDYTNLHTDLISDSSVQIQDGWRMLNKKPMNPKSTLQALGHPQSATVTQSFRRAARWNRRRSNEPGTLAGNVEGFYHLFPWLSPKHDFFEAGRLYPSLIARDRGSYLFLSNFGIASDPYIYRALDIKFVVNCSRDLPFVDEVASLLQSKPTGSTGTESHWSACGTHWPLSSSCGRFCRPSDLRALCRQRTVYRRSHGEASRTRADTL